MSTQEEEIVQKTATGQAPPGLLTRSVQVDEVRAEEKGCYGFKSGILAFVDEDGKVYVTPGTRVKIDLLESEGFKKRHPPIVVPFADGSVKSKHWLRKNFPKNEIKRSLEENRMPKVDVKVVSAIQKINRDGLKEVEDKFLSTRCAKAEQKNYQYVGLIGCYRGILSLTDWEGNTFLTPYSDSKREILENLGYVFVEAMIKVPHALDTKEDREWLAGHIPAEEWARTEGELKETRHQETLEKAKAKIEELGLEDLPQELLKASAPCEEGIAKYIGLAGAFNGVLSFTDPTGTTYVTPATSGKVELLKKLGYQFMGSVIKIPHSLKTDEDLAWLKTHIDEEYWLQAREENRKEQERIESQEAVKRQKELGLENLPEELLNRSAATDSKLLKFVGQYFVRNGILGFVDPAGRIFITPVTNDKLEMLEQANYQKAVVGFTVPYSDGKEKDRQYLLTHNMQGELDKSRKELKEEKEKSEKETLEKTLERLGLGDLPEELMKRSAKTEMQDIELLGKYSSRGGVTCFVFKDAFYYVTPTVPWKEAALEKAGYKLPKQLIRVPYASNAGEDREWLKRNLPEGEFEKCRREMEELEKARKQEELKKELQKRGIEEQVPENIASRAVRTEMTEKSQIGRYLVQNEFLAFVGPDTQIWITPNTPSKLEALKAAGYEHSTRKFNVPHATGSAEDAAWREKHLPRGEMDKSRQELEGLEAQKLEKLARDLAEKRKVKDLPGELLERSARAQKVAAEMVGRYLERNGMIYFVTPDRLLYITPFTKAKLKTVSEAGYQFPEKILKLPYFSGSEEDLKWIQKNLPEGEMEKCREEEQDLEKLKIEEKIKKNIEKFSLKSLPEKLLGRSVDSGMTDPHNIGRLGTFRGVIAFVQPDERVFVSWYTGEKEEILEDAGYKLEGYMPIKVPHAMKNKADRQWLLDNLPEPDEEEELSRDENEK